MESTVFSPELRENEKIIWSSETTDYNTWKKVSQKCVISFCAIMTVFIAFVAILVKNLTVIAIFALIGVIPIIFLLKNITKETKKVKSFKYALTDQRAIIHNGSFHSEDYKNIKTVRSIIDCDEIQSVYFSLSNDVTKEFILKTLTSKALKPGEPFLGNDIAFYCIDDCGHVLDLLKQYVCVDESIRHLRTQE